MKAPVADTPPPIIPWLHTEAIATGWQAQVYERAISHLERRLVYARREGQTYSSYARWAERLEFELADMRRLANEQNREGS